MGNDSDHSLQHNCSFSHTRSLHQSLAIRMTSLSQSPRDRILWILANNGGKMERSRLRVSTGMRYALLNPILDELMKEGRIRITVTMKNDIVSLASG
jgi:predicted transcriptional regulator